MDVDVDVGGSAAFALGGGIGEAREGGGGQDGVAVSEDLTASEPILRILLQRFTERHLDQFENVRFGTGHGPLYVLMTRVLPPGWPPAAFTAMARTAPARA